MPRSLPHRRIGGRIFLPFAALLVSVAILFSVIGLQVFRKSAEANAANELRILSVTLSRQVARQLERIESSLTSLGSHGSLIEELKKPVPNRDLLEEFLFKRLELLPLFDDFAIFNRTGVCIASTNEHWYGISGKKQPFFTSGLKTFNFSDVFTSDEGKIQLVSSPLFDGSVVRGVIVGQVNLSSIYDLMNQKLGASENTDAFLVDSGLRFITPGKAIDDTQLESHLLATPLLKRMNREFWVDQYQNFEDVLVLGTAHKLPGRRWYVVVEREIDVILRPIRDAGAMIGVGVVSLILVLVLVTLMITHSITRPLKMVVDGVQKVADGNFSDPIKIPKGIDELRFLAHEFEKMRIKVHAYQERMEERLEISERERRDNQRLAALGSLASTLAHEIRNPLNAMSLLLSRLEGGKTPQEQRAGVLGGLRSEIGRLDRLVSDILDYARPVALNRERLNLKSVLSDICQLYYEVASAKNLQIDLKLTENPIEVFADSDKIKQCIMNLLQNAVDASPAQSVVSLKLTAVDGMAYLRVEDEGKGITSENEERLFDLFFTTKVHGTGLGLSTVKKIVDAHGGRVEIKNRDDKQGAVANVWLPLDSQI